MADRSARNRAWQRFWTSDRIASCAPDAAATEDEINARWRSFFASLPEGSRILDIATGNGALLRQAAATADGSSFELIGVDLAAIDPLAHAPGDLASHPNIRFIGGVDATDLPFDDDSVDVVVSQYGLEYADLDAAITEVERVLKHGGRLQWLAHSEFSEVVIQNREQHHQVALLLAPAGPLDAMSKLVERLERGKSPGLTMNRLDKSMRAAETFCREHPPASIVREVCSGLADTANRWQAYAVADLRKMVGDTRQKLSAHRERIVDLGDAVLTSAREEQLRTRLATSAWQFSSIETMVAGKADSPIGLVIGAVRRDCRQRD